MTETSPISESRLSGPTVGSPGTPMFEIRSSPNGRPTLSARLNPVVVTFARLLAMTSWRVLWASIPLAAM